MLGAILLFLNYVEGDWVEIAPVRNGKNSSIISTPSFYHTTPDYESIMRAPVSTNVVITTPAYENYEDHTFIEKQFMENNVYSKQSLFSEGHKSDLPVGGFFAFLQIIQENLLKSASHGNKISVLKNLRDTLLSNLYTHISILWKNPKGNPRARGLKDDDHEMDFPSNEGALMTIGFLTFGVFLIKLVIKLVQALKSKYANSVTTTTTTAATLVFLKRKKREEFTEKTAKITAFIDELPY
ncbi:unnamed protein product [Phyllotreta striolata]|uniref:Uncharacterized protein n=1 Tax=Phyllotreta striolata TaxID=444603 RepID=A0A9N9XQA8_PHYSR|nr:unnamed protein product [Phyllotreta striolata]